MTIGMSDETRRTAARVVGAAYLIALVPAIFAEFYVRGQLVVSDNAAQTALNIVAHERLFRLGIASNLAVFAIDKKGGGMELIEIAPGVSLDDLKSQTEAAFRVRPGLG